MPSTSTSIPTPTPEPAILVGAGDIARCFTEEDEATADLIDAVPGTVFTLGDNAYPDGSADDFAQCYEPSWGRHRNRTRPAVGNHEYVTPDAEGYFSYFGDAAGDPSLGYYSYELAGWLIIVLNTNCSKAGCRADQNQVIWLRELLESSSHTCILAYGHHPRYSSGPDGSDANMIGFWEALYDHGADIVLAAHSHMYERFAPMDPYGNPDPERGIRSFVVGTGGGSLHDIADIAPYSEVVQATDHGVLKLTLYPEKYTWEFIPVAGKVFTDSGEGMCR